MSRWRVGRHLGRTIYDGDRFEGILESPELAARVVELLNGSRYAAGGGVIAPPAPGSMPLLVGETGPE